MVDGERCVHLAAELLQTQRPGGIEEAGGKPCSRLHWYAWPRRPISRSFSSLEKVFRKIVEQGEKIAVSDEIREVICSRTVWNKRGTGLAQVGTLGRSDRDRGVYAARFVAFAANYRSC